MQKSNKKNQGFEKMAKNGGVCLNPPNSPQKCISYKKLVGSNSAGFLTAYGPIFLTPFFQGRHTQHYGTILLDPKRINDN
jgi:hypothetical protein